MADRSPQHNENRQIAATSDVAPKWRSHCFTRRPQGGKDCYTSDSSTLLRFVGHEKTQPTLSRGLGLNNEHLAEAEGFEPLRAPRSGIDFGSTCTNCSRQVTPNHPHFAIGVLILCSGVLTSECP